MTETQSRMVRWFWLKTGSVLGVVVVVAFFTLDGCGRKSDDDSHAISLATTSTATPLLPQRIELFCSRCHENPPADTFPRSAWKDLIERMYEFAGDSGRPLQPPPIDEVVRYFERLAPEHLPPAILRYADRPLSVKFQRLDSPDRGKPSCISNLKLVHLFDPKKLDVLACDMKAGLVLVLQPYLTEPEWRVLYDCGDDENFHPAHAEVVDLDGDRIDDILVANLGSFLPTDRRLGSVLWLRGRGDGSFEPITLLKGKGRIADVQAADFNGDGKLDLLVACFGWKTIGEIYYLENTTKAGEKPSFTVNLLDERHGAIHVPIADLNGDGKPDFVALISQEHETIVAFVNDGKGHFQKQTLYKAPHPGYGSSGIELTDLNGDGKLDVLYTNGDVLDRPYLLKPYHGVQWLENKGEWKFEHHPLTSMYGVHRAVAADLDGDGDLDIVAVGFLPAESFPERKEKKLDSILVLEQTSPGVFVRHSLEKETCDYVTCAVGNVFDRGKLDIVVGNFSRDPAKRAIAIWKNLGTERRANLAPFGSLYETGFSAANKYP